VRDKVKVRHARRSVEDHVLVASMKLGLALLQDDLVHKFGLELTIVSNVYRLWLPVWSNNMRALIVWPNRSIIRNHIPIRFREENIDIGLIL